MAQQDEISYTPLMGGLDLQSSALTIKPGKALDLHNYEPAHGGGYRRVAGYERYNGLDGSTQFSYYTITVDITTGISVNQTLTGSVSAAAGYVAGISGTTLVMVLYPGDVVGDYPFVDADTVVSATVNLTSAATARDTTSSNDATYLGLLTDWVRTYAYADVGALSADIPGSGPVRGVAVSGTGSIMFGFRDNALATAGAVYWASVDQLFGGWTACTMASILQFDGGTGVDSFVPGDIVKGATSGATATILRIARWSGTDAGLNSAGYFAISAATLGPFVNNENLQREDTPAVWNTKCLANGAESLHARLPGGKCTFANHDFTGGNNSFPKIFGADTVNPGFEITSENGGYLIPILMPTLTGAPATNAPKYVEIHKNFLFLSFAGGGSIQHSVLGDPFSFNGFLGAEEFLLGDECTGMKSLTGGGLALYTRQKTFMLTGSSTADWALVPIAEKTGAIDYTVQSLGQSYSLDDYGLTALQRVQAYGDFDAKPLTQHVQRALDKKILAPLTAYGETATNVIGSFVVRKENQYKVLFSDGSGMTFYIHPRGWVEAATFEYPDTMYCVYGHRMSDGKERHFAGSATTGRVYEINRGNSFDGASIYSVARLPFNHLKSPRQRKSYRQMELETELQPASVGGAPSLVIYAEIDFGSQDNVSVTATGARISAGMNWEIVDGTTTYWTTAQEKATSVPLDGTGNNISFTVVNSSAIVAPYILQGMVLRYRPRRPDRS